MFGWLRKLVSPSGVPNPPDSTGAGSAAAAAPPSCHTLPDGGIDISAEINRAFEGQPIENASPSWVLILGGVASGKTTLRREKYASGYVTLDAAEIFLRLCQGRYVDFPPPPNEGKIAEALEQIGYGIALRAVQKRCNIVTELIGPKPEVMERLLAAMQAAKYKMKLVYVECDPAVGWERNLARGRDNISAVYTEPFHLRWALSALELSGVSEVLS